MFLVVVILSIKLWTCFSFDSSGNTQGIKRIGVLTSGGDCPSLNACIRAIAKTANAKNIEVYGLPKGFASLIMNDGPSDVFMLDESFASATMLTKGGSRLGGYVKDDYKELLTMPLEERRFKISNALNNLKIDGIIASGGDTSLSYIARLLQHAGESNDIHIPFIGIPKTIDNDIPETTYSLGFQSAVSVASSAIANVRDTAESHRSVIVVECMGRDAGFLTLHAGLAGGADAILLPEFPIDTDDFLKHIEMVYAQQKCGVIAVSEAVTLPQAKNNTSEKPRLVGSAETVSNFLSESLGIDTRHVVLGHLQRGGSPNAFDQILATTLGAYAVNFLCDGISEVFVKWNGQDIETVPLENVRDVPSKILTADYPSLRAAQSMGIYCGSLP